MRGLGHSPTCLRNNVVPTYGQRTENRSIVLNSLPSSCFSDKDVSRFAEETGHGRSEASGQNDCQSRPCQKIQINDSQAGILKDHFHHVFMAGGYDETGVMLIYCMDTGA